MRIGVFDSGVGGLTVFSALHEALPQHDLFYLGDTARVPYGTRSADTVIRYSCRVASYLAELRVDVIVIACNTATTYALDVLEKAAAKINIQVFGVIEPGIQTAIADADLKSLAIIGTPGTISGGAYQKRLQQLVPEVHIIGVPCPLFVPLAEEGWTRGEVPERVSQHYLGDLNNKVDTVILGCTHYPLLHDVIQNVLPNARLVDSASAMARVLNLHLGAPDPTIQGQRSFFVTDHIERFTKIGQSFLGWTPDPIQWVDLGPASGPFVV